MHSGRSDHRRRRALGGVALAGLLAVACGSDDDTSATVAETAATDGATEVPAETAAPATESVSATESATEGEAGTATGAGTANEAGDQTDTDDGAVSDEPPSGDDAEAGAELQRFPDVIGATATFDGETWTVSATLSSPYDTPERYADSWRVLGPDGSVYGERFLFHDHQNEQPFTRSESGIVIPDDVDVVTIEGRDQQYGWGGGTFELTLER